MKNLKQYAWLGCVGLLVWCILACGMMMFSQDGYNWRAVCWQLLGHVAFVLAVHANDKAKQARKENA